MRKLDSAVLFAAAAVLSSGCSSPSTSTLPSMPMTSIAPSSHLVAMGDEELDAIAPIDQALTVGDLAGLPTAPWAVAPVAADTVPAELLAAWAQAENRTSCAPIAPAALGAADGARARRSEMIQGGWAVEFDHRGMPGLGRDGSPCAQCGRGVFGIAGTGMTSEELPEDPAPSFADGSHFEVEVPAEGESVAAAMITVRGQSCVYQVWSFLGESHVREIVDGLRRVDTSGATSVAAR